MKEGLYGTAISEAKKGWENSWYFVQILPTKQSAPGLNTTNEVGGLFRSSLPNRVLPG
jgi:hypothetical protein